MLAIFDEMTDIDQLNSFLLALDRDGAKPLFTPDRKHRDSDPKDNVADTLKRLYARCGCLLVFPHPDQPNGVCKGFQPVEAAKLLKEISPDALEHCPEAEIQRLQSTGVLNSRFFERLALVEFSDPKRIEEIGTKRRVDGVLRATYLKLSATNVEALRLALHDPEMRLCIGEVPAAAHARVQRIMESNADQSYREELVRHALGSGGKVQVA